MHGGNPPTIAETLSAGKQYSRDNCPESEDDGLNHEEGEIDKPLYDLQSQDKLEFKKFLRLQREGLVNLNNIF